MKPVRSLAPLLLFVLAAACAGVDAAGEPELLFTSTRDGGANLWLLDAEGTARRFSEMGSKDSLPAWSPDGKRIAFCSSRNGNVDIYVMNADGSEVKQLTNEPANDLIPGWSPDGKKIVFMTRRTGDNEVFVMNADGSDPVNLTNQPGFDGDPAWSPDGKSILFGSNRDGQGYRLYLMGPDGANARLLPLKATGHGAVFPCWAPDGKRIAFSDRVENNAVEIFISDLEGKNRKQLTQLGGTNSFAAWSPDGKRVAFQHWDTAEAAGTLWTVGVEDGVQNNLGQTGPFLLGRPAWKPRKADGS